MSVVRVITVAALALAIGAAIAIIVTAPAAKQAQRPSDSRAAAAPQATITKELIRQQYTFSGTIADSVAPRPLSVEGVVTATPIAHREPVRTGSVLLEVNGRPTIGLNIPFPLWRDIEMRSSGKDVAAVQTALAELGHYRGVADGKFDAETAQAVRSLYRYLGYPSVSRRSANNTVLPLTDVAALGGGRWRLDLGSVVIGSVLGGEGGPSISSSGTSLTVEDGGKLARVLSDGRPRSLLLALGDGGGQIRVRTQSSSTVGNRSRVLVRSQSKRLVRGEVAGTAVVRSTRGPVLSVPITALRPAASGTMYVRAIIGGRARDVPVRIGIRGDRLVEVSGRGLAPGLSVELL